MSTLVAQTSERVGACWPPGRLHLSDLTTLEDATIPDPQLVALLYEGTNLSEELVVAVLVRSDFLRTPDLRFASAAKEILATTFTDLTSACAYLGISTVEIARRLKVFATSYGDAR